MSKLAILGGKPVRKKDFPKWPIYGKKEYEMLKKALESGVWGIGGKLQEKFEEEFAKFQQAKYCITCVNGTAALEVALRAAKVGAGDEVIVPAYTFMATANAVLMIGAVCVFVDIDPDSYLIDPVKIEEAITKKTKAIIPVHIAGCPADMDKILKIGKKYNLKIIEDSAQAHGAEWNGKRVGALGDMGTFSFQSSKNLSSGEGGAIVTNSDVYYQRCWSYHNCGRIKDKEWYEHFHMGWNYRLTEFQAAILLSQIKKLPKEMEIRTNNARDLTEKLNKIDGITPLKVNRAVTKHAYHLYIFKYDEEEFDGVKREVFIKALNAEGIPCHQGYLPLHKAKFLEEAKKCPLSCHFYNKKMDYSRLNLPVTEKACYKEAVWLNQRLLLGNEKDMDDIYCAIEKIKNNVKDLHSIK